MRAVLLALLGGAIASGAAPARDAASDDFVTVRAHELVLGGQPFRFVGANLAIMHGPESRAAAEEVMTGAARDGIRVGRIWALGEGAADASPWLREHFLFRAGPEGWIDAAADHLDRVIAAAGRAGLRLIITLANGWGDYGGVPRYLRWAGRWRDDRYGAADRFYDDPRARAAYRAHVERLLRRTNHLTGVAYRDDPTIMAWELINESTVATAAGAAARRRWIVEMARLIHALDPNHLVTPGVSGYRFERERRDWLAVCRLPEVDFCDGHIYPEELLRNRDPAALESALDDYVQLGQHLGGKPFVLGEFGVRGDGAGLWLGKSRASWLGRILERLRFDGAAGGLVWIYQRTGGPDRAHGIGVGEAGAEAIRAVIRDAAAAPAPPPGGFNPALGPARGEAALMPLHAEFAGQSAVLPLVTAGGPSLQMAWDPTGYDRADWEASGVYDGGAVEHVWGGESGWFEYAYEVMPGPAGAPRADPVALSLRARVSSEYPGALSPPDGASAFEVTLDGAPLGAALAPRDDGRGRWLTLRSSRRAVLRAAAAPGRHRLRFLVAPGPRAHGLCLYGRPGQKPVPGLDTAPVELRVDLAVSR